MDVTPPDDFAAEVEAVVRTTPGVAVLFRPGGTVSRLVDAGARLLGIRDTDAPLVIVSGESDGVAVEVAVGVRGASSAVACTQLIHDSVGDLLAERGLTPRTISVTVVHVDAEEERP